MLITIVFGEETKILADHSDGVEFLDGMEDCLSQIFSLRKDIFFALGSAIECFPFRISRKPMTLTVGIKDHASNARLFTGWRTCTGRALAFGGEIDGLRRTVHVLSVINP